MRQTKKKQMKNKNNVETPHSGDGKMEKKQQQQERRRISERKYEETEKW